MGSLSEAAAAPVHISHGGKDYAMSPLGIGDLAEFQQWAEDRAVERVEKHIARLEKHGAVDADEKRALLDELRDELESGAAEARAATMFAGIRLMLWMSLRQRHPELTIEQVGRMVTPATAREAQDKLDRVSGLAGDDGAPTDPKAKAGPTGRASTAS